MSSYHVLTSDAEGGESERPAAEPEDTAGEGDFAGVARWWLSIAKDHLSTMYNIKQAYPHQVHGSYIIGAKSWWGMGLEWMWI